MDASALRRILREGRSPLADLPDDVLDKLVSAALTRKLAKGEALFTEGEVAEWTYILIGGGVRLVRTDHHGREQVLHSVRRGESFAEAAFFGEGTYPATALASTPSRVLGLSRKRMLGIIADCVPFAYPEAHRDIIRNRAILVACPKLDDIEAHTAKLVQILSSAHPRSLMVYRLEVPCCGGLVAAARGAVAEAGVPVPVSEVVIGVRGEVRV